MLKVWLMAALCTAAFAETVTYNYSGSPFTVCNGATYVNGNCPANFSSDYNTASFTFSAPLAAGLSSANELSSPNLTAWTLSDAHGLASYSSTDLNAATELTELSVSTNGSNAITGWGIQGPNFAPGSGVPYFLMDDPTVIAQGTGQPLADAFVNTANNGFSLGNGTPGTWTQTLNGFQGGPASAPVFVLGGSPVGGVSGSIGGPGAEEYYGFYWGGGAFSASADVSGAGPGTSYQFTEGTAGSFCSGGASETLNSGDSFTNTIGIANLAPGQYCIGLETNSVADPIFAFTFFTPVSGVVPEPSGLIPLFVAFGVIVFLRHTKLRRS